MKDFFYLLKFKWKGKRGSVKIYISVVFDILGSRSEEKGTHTKMIYFHYIFGSSKGIHKYFMWKLFSQSFVCSLISLFSRQFFVCFIELFNLWKENIFDVKMKKSKESLLIMSLGYLIWKWKWFDFKRIFVHNCEATF